VTVHILRLACPDRPGIVASVARALFEAGGNILDNAQHTEPSTGTFCMRTRVDLPEPDAAAVAAHLRVAAPEVGGELSVRREDDPPRVLVMASREGHCLVDLLHRHQAGELGARLVAAVSNHADLGPVAEAAGVPFEVVPVTPESKPAAEARLRELVAEHRADLVVLARYMQILSPGLADELAGRAINIHHSFLPGFKGARPYQQAWDRGVKLIGATAHFVTADLDEGPIIDQDVVRVSHAVSAAEMVVLGRDVERVVLARAVRSWAEGRVFLQGRRTVVLP